MQVFDFDFINSDTLDVALEMNDGKVLFFNNVEFSRDFNVVNWWIDCPSGKQVDFQDVDYDHQVNIHSMMNYYCMSADWNEIEYHPTIGDIRKAIEVIINFLNDNADEDISHMLPDWE